MQQRHRIGGDMAGGKGICQRDVECNQTIDDGGQKKCDLIKVKDETRNVKE